MIRISNRDLIGGVLLLLTGIFISVHVGMKYELGTFRHMGPGMFPFNLGIILAMLGAAIAAQGALRGCGGSFAIRPPIFILGSVSFFAFFIDRAGAVVAILLTVFVAALAESKPSMKTTFLLAISIILGVWLTFVVGLGSVMKMFAW